MSTSKDAEEIPPILRPWVSSYRAVPKLYIPGTSVDVTFSLISAVFLASVRISARYFLMSLGWPPATFFRADCAGSIECEATLFAAACTASLFHCWTLLPGLGACLYYTKVFGGFVPSSKMSDAPKWWQDATAATIAFCTGYMIYDSVIGYVVETWVTEDNVEGGGWFGHGKPVLNSEDVTYLGHHILCTLCMLSARIQGAGHLAAMIMMFTGEFTAPIMNKQLILEKAIMLNVGGDWVHGVAPAIEQVYSFLYVVFRIPVIGIGYVCAAHLTYDLFLTKRGRTNMPIWLSLAWMPMIWGVLIGSIPTLYGCFDILKAGPLGGFLGGEEL